MGGSANRMPLYAWKRRPPRVVIHEPRMVPAGVFVTGASGSPTYDKEKQLTRQVGKKTTNFSDISRFSEIFSQKDSDLNSYSKRVVHFQLSSPGLPSELEFCCMTV